ncbi:hypothetical protein [Streptomyces chartreusis]|uniref:hypothetical protein n=1 Tax=Streptomyces chartreusis TaxID=1969 RepID=UPI0037DCCA5E|nr:hypothetical protein OG938_47895 [Streptomyces chartreusis]
MRARSINRNTGEDRQPSLLVSRTFWFSDVPRLIPVCRMVGHKPVVDGTDTPCRWVACDRCGIRANPQGNLDPALWDIGQPYTGPFNPAEPLSPIVRKQLARKGIKPARASEPGPIPAHPVGTVGGEVHIGKSKWRTVGIDFKVGNCGSEQVLAASLRLGPLGSLYLHTEDHGRWLQRRLNPTGYQSRETGLSYYRGRLSWQVWARRDEHRASDPKWMSGSVPIDPRHYLYGPRKNRMLFQTEKVPAVVRMPEGDTHDVLVHLEKWETRRTRGRARTYWMAQWDCKKGIPVRNHDWKGDETFSSAWTIQGVTPDNPRWPLIIAAAAAEDCSRDRARYNYRAPSEDAA